MPRQDYLTAQVHHHRAHEADHRATEDGKLTSQGGGTMGADVHDLVASDKQQTMLMIAAVLVGAYLFVRSR